MKLKLISIAALIAAGVLVVVGSLAGYANRESEYNRCLAKARANAEKDIPYNAYHNYQAAFEIHCEDEDVYREFLSQAQLLGGSYYSAAIEDYVVKFPQSADGYERLCKLYYDRGNYRGVIDKALEANGKGAATEAVRDMYLECAYMLRTIKTGLEDAQSFLGGYARVQLDGKYGYIKSNGSYLLAPQYEDASVLMGSNMAVKEDNDWHMINMEGFVVARTSEKVDSLSILSSGKISVSKNGKYGYTTSAMTVPTDLLYDYASTFKNGVAAVKRSGKWALFNAAEEPLTEFVFEDVLLDEFDACINSGVVFAKRDGKYFMYNAEGAQISQQGFDAVQPFASSEPAAVCVNGKWGFVNTKGEMVIEPKYSNARSFSIGLGAVCVDGKWGYINSGGETRIEYMYEDCKPFAANGIAAVKVDGVWMYVQLLSYQK